MYKLKPTTTVITKSFDRMVSSIETCGHIINLVCPSNMNTCQRLIGALKFVLLEEGKMKDKKRKCPSEMFRKVFRGKKR